MHDWASCSASEEAAGHRRHADTGHSTWSFNIPPSCRPCIRSWDLSDTGGSVIRHALCTITDHRISIPFVSPSLDWLAWLGLASLASAWLVSSAAATTTATTPEEAATTTGAARSAAPVVLSEPPLWLSLLPLELWLLLWLLPTRRATLRQGEPSQARQANQGTHKWLWLSPLP